MQKRLILILICVAVLFSFSGCVELREYAREASEDVSETPQVTEDLPTLPVDNPDNNDVELLPLEVFTSYVEYTPPDISNDGNTILYRHISGFSDAIIAENWKTGEQTAVEWPSEAAGIPYFYWAPDGETVLFFVDNMGDENYGLYTSNIKTGETKTILPGGENNCYYVADDKNDDKEIYVEILDFNRKLYDLYLLNYETGDKTLVLRNPGDITGYTFDQDGKLMLVTTNDDRAGKHVWINTDFSGTTEFSESDWKEILSWDYEDAGTSGVWTIMQGDEELMYTDSSKNNTTTLYYYDIATGESSEIFNDPNYDIRMTWTDLDLNKVTAVTVEGQKTEWHVLDSSFQDDYDVLSEVGEDFDIYDSSENDDYWIVAYMSDVKETDYYLYDMANHELKFLYNAQPDLQQYEFAHTEPFSYTAGDGLKIEGYATFPAGAEKSSLPTVALVHGGPWSRDTWGYNPEVQFLANRGYLVLQVNFRGSSGYGKDFMNAGDKEWGGKMHQDILDAVSYAVDQGWTDPDRVGVYGASYGGYEALVCAAFSSDVFKCAVDAFGPSSLLTFIESIPPQWSVERADLLKAIGDPDKDAEFMKSHSPLYFAEDMKIPLLIAQGENDVRVPQRESDQMVEALRDAGIDVTYMLFENTGHGFGSNQDRMTFYSAMEKFFAENLGGKIIEGAG
jgi:dipeptidyl aminopeptidase/acylaminoacyl peptidase